MPATTSYQAGVEANAVQLSYGVEAVWGTKPATTFQAVRMTSESLASTKTRQRPAEIQVSREAVQAVTTQESAGGSINFALSYGTYDDLLSGLLGADWSATTSIAGVAGDLALAATAGQGATLTSTTAGKFTGITVGQFVRTLGFTNAANNAIWYVSAATGIVLTLVSLGKGVPVTETPAGVLGQVRACSLRNGTQFQSFFMQKKLASNLWLQYPGTYVSKGSISGGTGQFLSGSFDLLAQQEENTTTDASTGGVLPAPAGSVHNPVGGFQGVFLNETPVSAVVDSFTVTLENTGAALEFGLGDAAAAGILGGLLTASGTLKMFFKDFSLYTAFLNETQGRLEFVTADNTGNAYVISLLNNALMNPQILAGGPNQAVYASFTLEGNPQVSGSGTVQIDRLPAV